MTLLETVVKALADLVVSIDLSDEEAVSVEFASDVTGDLTAVFDLLDDGDREQISEIISGYARSVSDARRRGALEGLPEALGLADEDEED